MTREELLERAFQITWELGLNHAVDFVLEEAAKAIGELRWLEVEPYDGRTLGAAVVAIRALKG